MGSDSDNETNKAIMEKSLQYLHSRLKTLKNGTASDFADIVANETMPIDSSNNTIANEIKPANTGSYNLSIANITRPSPDYYNGEEDYFYTYEWDDSAKQKTGEDYTYSYEWAYKPHLYETPYIQK